MAKVIEVPMMLLMALLDRVLPLGLRPYAKTIVPGVATIAALVVQGIASGGIEDQEALATAVVGLVSVIVVLSSTNEDSGIWKYTKAILPVVGALVAAGIHLAISGEWNGPEMATLLTGLGFGGLTWAVPNSAQRDEYHGDEVDYDGHTTLGQRA